MTGTKTNERPGTRAQVRYLRMSASKARVVLDLVRNKHVGEADQILQFSERLAAKEIQKVLRSAVANAVHNDEIPADELFVSACYADEGPTLKRFRPRARGRAGRIHKQTCHITVIVSRLDDDELDRLRDRAANRGQTQDAAAARRARVARSRGEEVEDTEASEADVEETEVAEDVAEAEAETVDSEATKAAEAGEAAETDEATETDEVAEVASEADEAADPAAEEANDAEESEEGEA